MKGLFFLIKTCILTAIFVSFLQIKISQKTIEEELINWIKHSTLVQPLHTLAQSGILILKQKSNQMIQKLKFKFLDSDEYPMGQRLKKLKLKRSQKVLEQTTATVIREKQIKSLPSPSSDLPSSTPSASNDFLIPKEKKRADLSQPSSIDSSSSESHQELNTNEKSLKKSKIFKRINIKTVEKKE